LLPVQFHSEGDFDCLPPQRNVMLAAHDVMDAIVIMD